MLTRKQLELLLFINERLKEEGVPPSFEEMKEALNLQSKSGVHRLIVALEERGFLRRMPNRARALEVLKLPDAHSPSLTPKKAPGFTPNVIQGNLGRVKPVTATNDGAPKAAVVPLMGRIAAGVPISAIQDHTPNIAVPPEMLSGGEHFALEVKGDSMIDAGILDGDYVVCRQQSTANNGDIVVAGIPGDEATIKTFTKSNGKVTLTPSNASMKPMVFDSGEVNVYGKLVTVLRRLS